MSEKEDNAIHKVEQYYHELRELYNGAASLLLPQLDKILRQIEPSLKEGALRDTYIRLYLAVGSLLRLDRRKDFQVLAATTRSILELYFDMHLLDRNLISKGFEKFAEFLELKKFDIAKKRLNWAKTVKFPFAKKLPHRAEYLKKCDAAICKKRIQELWGTNVNHWSGRDVASRAAILGNQAIEYYLLVYDLGNWYVHSGPLNWAGLDETTAHLIAGFSYGCTADMFAESSQICIKNFNIKLDDH